MKHLLLLFALMPLSGAAPNPGGRVEYIGGTLADLPTGTGGRLEVTDASHLVFTNKQRKLDVPYPSINLLEYGQKADRRYLAAVLVSPVFLLSKKRDHFLTIGYADAEGHQQALVLKVEKRDLRPVLASLEARTGLRVTFQDNEARKAAWGSK
ncbi:MAG: hypothetical protein K2X03_22165 [Bryobacteraceae bacterium]|nr:hypothetical protein [Bryobacteraceae bacterium]